MPYLLQWRVGPSFTFVGVVCRSRSPRPPTARPTWWCEMHSWSGVPDPRSLVQPTFQGWPPSQGHLQPRASRCTTSHHFSPLMPRDATAAAPFCCTHSIYLTAVELHAIGHSRARAARHRCCTRKLQDDCMLHTHAVSPTHAHHASQRVPRQTPFSQATSSPGLAEHHRSATCRDVLTELLKLFRVQTPTLVAWQPTRRTQSHLLA
jgi:hypothetical protein